VDDERGARCARCSRYAGLGASFCPYCGTPLGTPPGPGRGQPDPRPTRTPPSIWLASLGAVVAMAPLAVFAVATVGRLLQPLPNEPAGTEERIYQWFVTLSGPAIVVFFIVLPVLAMAAAAVVLWRSWRADPYLRADTHQAATLGWRFLRRPPVWLSAAVLLVGLVLAAAAIIHGITG
jgi:hypothetical protein